MKNSSIRLSSGLFACCLLLSVGALAQTGVSINSTGTAPNANAILDVSSTTKGALLPRMTTGDRIAFIPTGLSGMTVFDITTQTYWYWDGNLNQWKEIPNTSNIVHTLDAAYDGSGAGLGRTITADAGNVAIQGAGYLTVASNVGIGTASPDRRMKISGAGWTALEVENTDAQDAAIELTSQGVSNYVYTDETGFLGLESASGKEISLRTDGPNERMVVQSDGRVRVNNLADAAGAVVLSNAAGVLGKRPLTGTATDVLLGTGVFGPASAFEDDDWYKSTTTVAPQSINDNIYTLGTVAIGGNITASAPLQVQAAGAGNPANNAILANNPNNSTGNDAIITARVAGSAAGDPFFSMDISGEAGWSMGVDNDHANRFKIAPAWDNLSYNTAMTIKSDGNVGVATDDPDQKLQVNGVIRSRGTNMIDIDAANVAGPRVAFGTTANEYAYMNMGAYNSMNQIETTTRDFRIGSNAATNAIYVQNATGNVGIGTSSPDANLNVGSANGASVYLTREGPAVINDVLGSILFDGTEQSGPSTTDASAVIRAHAAQGIGDSNKGAYLTFLTKNNVGSAVAATERMRIAANGNVGVGNNSPIGPMSIGNSAVAGSDGFIVVGKNDGAGGNRHMKLGFDASFNFVIGDYGNGNAAGTWTSPFKVNYAAPNNSLSIASTGIVSLGSLGTGLVKATSGILSIATGSDVPSGSGNYIQNQSTADQVASFRISGTGVVGPNSGGIGASQFKVSNSATDFADFRFSGTGMGQLEFVGWSSGWNINTMVNGKHLHINRDAGSSSDVYVGRSGLEMFVQGSTGKVGIGTTAPARVLEINDPASAAAYLRIVGSEPTGGDAGIEFSHPGVPGTNVTKTAIVSETKNTWKRTDLRFVLNNDANDNNYNLANDTRMIIQSSGNVGIGITNPGARLSIRNNATDPGAYDDGKALFVSGTYGSGQAADGGVEFRHDNLTQGIGFGYNTIYQTGTNTNEVLNLIAKGSGNLTLQAYNGVTGNVGIGTTGPGSKLDVNGRVDARSGLRTERRYTYYSIRRGANGSGYTYDLGNWDFCAKAGMQIRIGDDTFDGGGDNDRFVTECWIVLNDQWPILGSTTQAGWSWDYAYDSRPNWKLYAYTWSQFDQGMYESCMAVCVNFDY